MLYEVTKTVALLGWFAILSLLVAWVFVGMFISHRNRPWWRWAADRRAWIILVVLGAGLMLGTIGTYRTSTNATAGAQYWLGGFADALYEGAMELTINGSIQPSDSGFKRMARLAGLAAVVLLAYEAIQQLFSVPLQRFWLGRQRNHVVICGLGAVGRAIISDLTNPQLKGEPAGEPAGERVSEPGSKPTTEASPVPQHLDKNNEAKKEKTTRPMKLVVIERDKDNPDIPWAESRGVSVVIGNAADEEVLAQVRADQAKDIFFAAGSDELNLESAYDLMCIVNRRRNSAQPQVPRMFIHLLNPRLESMLVQAKHRAFEPRAGQPELSIDHLVVQPFNVIDRSIQALVDGPVLDRRPTKHHEIAHFVIVGFGEVGQELAVKLAQLSHYENLQRSRMTIVYSQRDKHAVAHFRELYPKFFPDPACFTAELAAIDRKPEDFNVWMPFEALDNWSFGVSINTKTEPDPSDATCQKTVIDVAASRGIEFVVNGGFEQSSGGVTCDRFIRNLEKLSLTRGIRPMVFICHSEDELNCADATELRNELDLRLKLAADKQPMAYIDSHEHRITILPYVPNRPMLHGLIDPANKPGADLVPWGDCRATCTHSQLTADMFRPLATAINHDYDLKYAQLGAIDKGLAIPERADVEVKPLDSMLAWQRHSNLMAAAHVNTKLAPLGLLLRPWPEGAQYAKPNSARISAIIDRSVHHQVRRDWNIETEDDRILEVVAKMEHHRWMAERLLMDWGLGHKSPKGSPENKRRLAFVDWDNLHPEEGVKDRDQIARILELCRDESKRMDTVKRFVLTVRE